ncbi:uncharacterized protein L203_101421 [Cryptococcus depauperatus CBS 7841]|uniref:Cytoplasmic protein n=1 Tax=Cryptococcus depauperatus CBS 7841 TaxID=1295531 RepID=A0AAJ8JPW5_9TREE
MSRTNHPTQISLPPTAMSSNPPLATPPAQPAQNGGPAGVSAVSPASPRHSFLGFMRARGRSFTTGHAGYPLQQQQQQSASTTNPTTSERSRPGTATKEQGVSTAGHAPTPTAEASTGERVTKTVSMPMNGTAPAPSASASPSSPAEPKEPPKTYRIRLVPHLESNRSLPFDPVIREMAPIAVTANPGLLPTEAASKVADPTRSGSSRVTVGGKSVALVLKIGRFTDKSEFKLPVPPSAPPGGSGSMSGGIALSTGDGTLGPDGSRSAPATLSLVGGGGEMTSGKVAFRSKVVSRSHAEIWCEDGGKFYIRDTKSSSGTFLNHIRLSSPNTESRPMMLKDGDILQLGVDYQGGTEEMFKCVKMRVEVGREWQRGANEFNTNALKQIKALGGGVATSDKGKDTLSKKSKASVTDCCICLFCVTVCQSLFIAPCSHVFHYKCIRPLLMQHYPGFSCPLCRTFANLEEDVETEDAWEIASRRASIISRRPSNHSLKQQLSTTSFPTARNLKAVGNDVDTAVTTSDRAVSINGLLPPLYTDEPRTSSSPTPVALHEAHTVTPTMLQDAELRSETISSPATATAPRPIFNTQDTAVQNATLSEAATPMNETFLSTLALAPGMLQRLELAEETSQAGTGTAGSTSTGSRAGSRRASGELEPQAQGQTHTPEQEQTQTIQNMYT